MHKRTEEDLYAKTKGKSTAKKPLPGPSRRLKEDAQKNRSPKNRKKKITKRKH
jgi:hypothetical protein